MNQPVAARLAEQECKPCRGGVPPLSAAEASGLLEQLDRWEIVDGHHLTKTFSLTDFAAALSLTNRIGNVAEQQRHHPDLHLSWGKVRVDIWTHKIDGLSESDFVLAAKIDAINR